MYELDPSHYRKVIALGITSNLIRMASNVKVVRKYYAIDYDRRIVAEADSEEEIDRIMAKKGYKKGTYDILVSIKYVEN